MNIRGVRKYKSIRIFTIIIFGLLSIVSGRTSFGKSAHEQNAPDVSAIYQCPNAWGELISDWEKSGGGFSGSLWRTRDLIRKDKKTRFAAMVRKIWSSQKRSHPSEETFGYWPVTDYEMNKAVKAPSRDLFPYLSKILPRDCATLTDFKEVIWDLSLVRTEKKVCSPRYIEMPSSIAGDPEKFSSWVIYWLFVRIDVPISRKSMRPAADKKCIGVGDNREWIEPWSNN